MHFLLFLWSFFFSFLRFILSVFSFFGFFKKLRVSGRSFDQKSLLKLKKESQKKKKTYCFLVSSAGEYEQALPFIHELEKQDSLIILLFVSLSGYEYAHNKKEKHSFFLAPFDILKEWRSFYKDLKNCQTFVVRYELWPVFLSVASRAGELYLLNASLMKRGSSYFSRKFHRYCYRFFNQIFLVDEVSKARFLKEYQMAEKGFLFLETASMTKWFLDLRGLKKSLLGLSWLFYSNLKEDLLFL